MYRPLARWRHVITVLTGLIGWAQSLHFTLAEELGLIQITLGKVFWRSDEVYQSLFHIQSHFVDVVKVTLGNRKDFLTVTAHSVEVTITATFAFPSKILVTLQPMDVVVGFHPCLVGIGKDVNRMVVANLGNPYLVGILFAVHLLDKEFVAFRDELHARNVVVAGITRNVDPGSGTTISRYITHLYGRVGSTCLRIREALDGRVDGIHIIYNVEPASTIGIALPISDELAVRAPTETVTTIEFFFVYPVESTVYYLFVSILGYLNNRTIGQCLYIDVVLRNISYTSAVRRELGKHQGCFRACLAQLL